ncbi:MAG: RagB/SusD domain protein [Marmoricola sp.]|nr:RagB/SusD domain protein [Marmoricola sp.]
MKRYILKYILLPFILFIFGCSEFVTVGPPNTKIASDLVFADDNLANSAMAGLYSLMMETAGIANHSVTLYAGLSADEFRNYSSSAASLEFSSNALIASNSNLVALWSSAYQCIYHANLVLEGIEKSEKISQKTRSQLQGEARFIRAFCHFYLLNLWGDVPLVTSTDYKLNSSAKRIGKSDIYQQIIRDLQDSQNLLSAVYAAGTRLRPDKIAATALLSRVYLYKADWTAAEKEATKIIDNPVYKLEAELSKVFLSTSSEAIFQLAPVAPNRAVIDAVSFIIQSTPGNVAINDELMLLFGKEDLRKTAWTSSYLSGGTKYIFPYKYKITNSDGVLKEYNTVLRLAELYLIRSEARARLNDFAGAQQDLNKIRKRAGVDALYPNTMVSMLSAIESEKRVEFFAEWGHRWLDLKRTPGFENQSITRAEELFSKTKINTWQSSDLLYPIPQSELNKAPQLVQNPGY